MKKIEEEVKIYYTKFGIDSLGWSITNNRFYENISNTDVVRYLKGIFTNRDRFEHRFINKMKNVHSRMQQMLKDGELDNYDHANPDDFICYDQMDDLLKIYDKVEPFTYAEAFKIEEQEFQNMVFGSIDIVQMINELGHTRLKTEGHPVKHKKFDINGEFLGYEEYDNIYEVHQVNGEKLGLEEEIYALKCWCTTTNKEHWLWIEDDYKDSPLEAVASTFRIHENLIPHIKELKRQGDVLLVEMQKDIEPEGEIIPLTSKQYFDLLTCQS